jgi:hypothetical protein
MLEQSILAYLNSSDVISPTHLALSHSLGLTMRAGKKERLIYGYQIDTRITGVH